MTEEQPLNTEVAEDEEFSAAAPPDPSASGAGETSFADAEVPPASEAAPAASGELEALTAERDKYLGLAQRAQADFDNYRKRMARENAAAAERGMSKLAKELLPALDHLELALKAAEGRHQPRSPEQGFPDGGEDVVKGFAMVAGELQAALARVGIQSFSPAGEPFDPNEHEAMAAQSHEDAESGTVVEVYQSGYRINGAVLRPARVVVAQ
jgi:molecular chaperone GrpE